MVALGERPFGSVDVLVNYCRHPFCRRSRSCRPKLDAIIATTYLGVHGNPRRGSPALIKRGWGRIMQHRVAAFAGGLAFKAATSRPSRIVPSSPRRGAGACYRFKITFKHSHPAMVWNARWSRNRFPTPMISHMNQGAGPHDVG